MGYGLAGMLTSVIRQGVRQAQRNQRQQQKWEDKQLQMSLAAEEVQEFEKHLEEITTFHRSCSFGCASILNNLLQIRFNIVKKLFWKMVV